MAAALGLFAVIVLGLILKSALAHSTPAAARAFGLVIVAVLASYVLRAVRVEVRITAERVLIRNILRTYRVRWDDIAAVQTIPVIGSPLFGGASFVAFSLTNGRLIRAQALRRTDVDATAIARDLSSLRTQLRPIS